MSAFPPIERLLPHAPPMLLVDAVLEHDPRRTLCRVDLARARLFADADGGVAPWIGLELLAQTIAAHAGLRAAADGLEPLPGLFLGTRRARFHAPTIAPDPSLTASVAHLRGERGLAQFDGRLYTARDERTLVEATLSVYLFDDLAAMRARLEASGSEGA